MIDNIFCCTRCGFCCHGETTVSLDPSDLEKMQLALKISNEEMFDKYLVVGESQVQMKTIDGHCIFYSENGCKVHEGRPWRCREWPLHPSILSDENNHKTISESCPGIKKDINYEQFKEALKQILDEIEKNGGW